MSKDLKILTFINLHSLLCFVLHIIPPCITVLDRRPKINVTNYREGSSFTEYYVHCL